jgi:murein L,D-transpeptidase YcbB/YkuD
MLWLKGRKFGTSVGIFRLLAVRFWEFGEWRQRQACFLCLLSGLSSNLCADISRLNWQVEVQGPSMPRRNASCSTVVVLIFMILTVARGFSAEGSNWSSDDHVASPAGAALIAPEASLRSLIRAGRLDDLRWPDFSEYRAEVQKLYSRSHYAPAWLHDGRPTPQAQQMISILQEADNEGLRAEDYDSYRWLERLAALQRPHSPADDVHFDVALTVCAMRYVSDVGAGRIDPRYFNFDFDHQRRKLDLAIFLQQHLAGGKDLKSELASIEPRFAAYRELRQALLKYMQLAQMDDGGTLPMPQGYGYPGPPYAGYSRLVRLLRLLGDLPQNYALNSATSAYDASLLQGVRRFQESHGLTPTGYLNAETIQQLNIPLSYRVQQIRLSMERYRWLPYDTADPAILVNIPGLDLQAFDNDGKLALSMKVDVGDDEDENRTPVLQARMQYLVFRPYWDVPLPIQREEFVPFLIEHDPNFLANHHFQVIARGGQTVSNRVTRTMLQQLRTGALRIRQRPGPDNPMGLVKFMFPNPYSVYLHDVPAWDYGFVLPQPLVSHGCVHVEKPAELAAWILRNQPGWSLERVRQAMIQGQNNLTVKLSKPLPVLFIYSTASPGEDGDVHFYRDIYGYDAELTQVLAGGYPYPK